MKKIYAFLAAALISVCAFASREQVPSDAVLSDYYDAGQVCVCIYVPSEIYCGNDIVLTGTYNDWSSDPAKCVKFEAIPSYDGWFVVAVDDDGLNQDGEPYENLQEKPVMLSGAGEFDWNFQIGAATVISGGVTVVEGGVPGEIDLKTYGTDAPNVFTVDAWKNNPCTVAYHDYKVVVISDGCEGFVVPFIIGGFNGWNDENNKPKFQQMQVDQAQTQANNAPTYYYSFRAAEGTEYQLLSGLMSADGTIAEENMPAWSDDSYLQELVDGNWVRINNGGNLKTAEVDEIVYDIRVDTLRWARCDGQVAEEVKVSLKAPEFAPASIEIIGGFDAWTGQAMTLNNGVWEATVTAKANQAFKFREAGNWDNQIVYYEAGTEEEPVDEWLTFGDGNPRELLFGDFWGEADVKVINLDFSNADQYKWQVPTEQAIENVVLTEKAQKVVVDGVLYIVRDNKMYNAQGTQVR